MRIPTRLPTRLTAPRAERARPLPRRIVAGLATTALLTLAVTGAVPAISTTGTTSTGAAHAASCTPTWDLASTPEGEGHVLQVTALSKRKVIFGAYDSGLSPWMLDWNGRRIQEGVQLPKAPNATLQFGRSSFASEKEGWMLVMFGIGGYWNTVARWHDGRWAYVPTPVSPDPRHVGLLLNDVVSLADDDAWAVGISYRAEKDVVAGAVSLGSLIEHWDGTAWRIVDNPAADRPGARLGALTAVADDDIWAVGTHPDDSGTTVPLIQHYDGESWTEVPAPSGNGPSALYGVSALGPNDVWAVGAQTKEGTDNVAVPFVLRWNGTEWTEVGGLPDVGNARLNGVYAAASDSVWAVGQFGENDPAVFLHWDGRAWSSVTPPVSKEPGLRFNWTDVDGTGPHDVWATGSVFRDDMPTTPQIAHLRCGRR
ncbi:MAG TPA: hypothetical protein VI076_01035 [Actinopolymorphaceae bacterium]